MSLRQDILDALVGYNVTEIKIDQLGDHGRAGTNVQVFMDNPLGLQTNKIRCDYHFAKDLKLDSVVVQFLKQVIDNDLKHWERTGSFR